MLLEVQQIAIKAKGLVFVVSGKQQRASRSFVAATRLDTNKAILHQIDAADSVASADFVQQFNQRYGVESLSTHRNWYAFFEPNFNLLFFVRSLLRRLRQLPCARERRVARVFQLSAFVADVPEIAIATVDLFAAGSYRDATLLGVVEAIFARFEIPFAPWCDNFQLGSKRLISHLKANLIVAFTSATMTDSRSALPQRDFNLMLCDHGTGERSSEQILIFINRTCFQRRPDVSGKKFFAQIFDNDLAGSSFVGLVDDSLDIISLTHVSDHGDHFVGVVFFEPWNDDGGIESTRVSKNNFFRFIRHERVYSSPRSDQ